VGCDYSSETEYKVIFCSHTWYSFVGCIDKYYRFANVHIDYAVCVSIHHNVILLVRCGARRFSLNSVTK
jgi:hypothetical protein